jgi:hypothetical protein
VAYFAIYSCFIILFSDSDNDPTYEEQVSEEEEEGPEEERVPKKGQDRSRRMWTDVENIAFKQVFKNCFRPNEMRLARRAELDQACKDDRLSRHSRAKLRTRVHNIVRGKQSLDRI